MQTNPAMTDSHSTQPSAGRPRFLGIVQFLSLLSMLPAMASYGLYGAGALSVNPYYIDLPLTSDGARFAGTHRAVALPLVLADATWDIRSGLLLSLVTIAAIVLALYAASSKERRSYLGQMALALAVPVVFVFGAVRFVVDRTPPNAALCFVWAPKIAFLWLAARGKILSKSTMLFILFTMFWAFTNIVMSSYGEIQTGSLPLEAFLPLFAMFLAILLARLVIFAITSNAWMLRGPGLGASLRGGAQALLLWAPLPLLAIPYFALEHYCEARLNQRLRLSPPAGILTKTPYQEGNKTSWDTQSLFRATGDRVDDSRPIVMVHDAFFLTAGELAFRKEIAAARATLGSVPKFSAVAYDAGDPAASTFRAFGDYTGLALVIGKAVNKAFPAVPVISFAPAELETGGGPLFDKIGDSIADSVQSRVASHVNEALSSFRNELVTMVVTSAIQAATEADHATTEAQKKLNDPLNRAEKVAQCEIFGSNCAEAKIAKGLNIYQNSQLNVWYLFGFAHGFEMLTRILFALICVKSFLYVFSRVTFHRASGTFLTLGETEGEVALPEARITRFPGRLVLHPEGPAVYYASRRFQGRGKPPRFSIPQPFGAPIARLLHRATTMNKVVFEKGDGPVSYTLPSSAEFLVWDLQPDEVVVFSFENFVAMSESVKISTLISARVTTLLLGRFIFSTATGPGQLILRTEGRAEVTDRDEAGISLPPDRLVAMHLDARLNVESELGLVDVYLSNAYVRPQGKGQIVVDVDRQDGALSGLSRFFRHFIWPG